MKILLLFGDSGVGKTTLMKQLCDSFPFQFHPILSYTDRPMREENEYGHIFLSKEKMQDTIKSAGVVAKTEIAGFFYCATADQFVDDKINIYIIDKDGYEMVYKNFFDENIITIYLQREIDKNDFDDDRINRKINFPKNPYDKIYLFNANEINYMALARQLIEHFDKVEQ